jgi:hypothetical protein
VRGVPCVDRGRRPARTRAAVPHVCRWADGRRRHGRSGGVHLLPRPARPLLEGAAGRGGADRGVRARGGFRRFEPATLRLTAELVVAASHCKHKYLDVRKTDYRVNWGDSGGTLNSGDPDHSRKDGRLSDPILVIQLTIPFRSTNRAWGSRSSFARTL